jgi:hypothetical protein
MQPKKGIQLAVRVNKFEEATLSHTQCTVRAISKLILQQLFVRLKVAALAIGKAIACWRSRPK